MSNPKQTISIHRVTYEPTVNLLISGSEPMDTVIVDVVTRFGMHQTDEHKCGYKAVCNITLTISDDMKPYSKILVYYVKDKDHVYKGQTYIESKKLARNTVSISLCTVVKNQHKKVDNSANKIIFLNLAGSNTLNIQNTNEEDSQHEFQRSR
jgi:hypothetical protein